jgi:hypothetical protein
MKIEFFSAILLLALTGSPAAAQPSAALAQKIKNFQQTTEFKFGRYKLLSGPPACQTGELRALPLDDNFTLMLGMNGLVFSLGTESDTSKEDNCTTVDRAIFKKGEVQGHTEVSCKGEALKKYDITVTKTTDGLNYARLITQGGRTLYQENCSLALEQP